ncbi:MAG: addiction module protein [Prosthecobacter sp.]|uniref:addiction module protein n=1 Tax=Prosthecobacter sp. TaxID=1965333 RepID=UPI00390331D5
MTATVERIKQQIRSLASDEAEELLRDLQHEYPSHARSDDEAEADAVEAEWDAEIDARVKEIEDGTVQLLTAEESERRSDAVFAKLGIQRPVYRP